MLGKNEYLLVSLSFNSYSTNGVAAIASKVTDEFTHDSLNNVHENDDFEFSVEFSDEFDLSADEESSSEGKVQSVFPIFNRDLLLQGAGDNADCVIRRNVSIKIPLKEIFIGECEEHSENSSNSSTEGDDSEQKAARTAYCLWRPKFVVESSPEKWKKSRSTGQGTRRWKLRDLLWRSNSDGKRPFVFPIPKHVEEKIVLSKNGGDLPSRGRNSVCGERKLKTCEVTPPRSPLQEVFYLGNREEKDGGKRKSYLPYRQNIFAFFSFFIK